MAIIIPFADADAHGSICDTVSFRRSRGKVVFQKKPKPKQPNTPAQQSQKQWWKDTWKAWRQLSADQLAWLQAKAAEEQTTPANYYFDKTDSDEAYTRDDITFIETITAGTIDVPVAPAAQDLSWRWFSDLDPPGGTYNEAADIWDNENNFVQRNPLTTYDAFLFLLFNDAAYTIQIPEDYSLTFTYTKFGGGGKTITVKFPALEMTPARQLFIYADTSWALYDDWPLVDPIKLNPQNWPPG